MGNATETADTSTVTDSSTEETESTVTAGTETEGGAGETKDAKTETKDAAGETKPDAKAEAAKLEKAAAALELQLPEGLDAKHPSVAAFRKLAAEQGLDSPKAQKLFDAHRAELAATEKSVRESTEKAGKEWLDNQRKEWRGALEKDAEYGGAKYAETKAAVSRVFTKYGASDKELRAFLNEGAGDHPALVKFLARIGRDMAEDTAATKGKAGGEKPKGANADLQKLFNKSPELFTS